MVAPYAWCIFTMYKESYTNITFWHGGTLNRRRSTELTVTERAAFIGWRLMTGDEWTTQEVASLMGMSWHGADRLLGRIALILPIYRDEHSKWRRIQEKHR